MLRLRLRIQRNELPAVTTLWPIVHTQLRNTIAQLLDDVNAIFPLESTHWGLEHYTVSIGGYECLHYHELGAVFKDEDEVVIKPLEYADVRARTLLGRDQITEDGKHLIDGVPYGRPLLKRPSRPDLNIPPRKRAKLVELPYEEGAEDESGLDGEAEAQQAMLLSAGDEDEDEEDSEDDEDFQPESDEDNEDQNNENEDDEESDEAVSSVLSSSSEDKSSSGESSSGDSSDSDSDSESSSEGSSSDDSWKGIPSSSAPKSKNTLPIPTAQADVRLLHSENSLKRKRRPENDTAQTNGGSEDRHVGIPFEGKPETKSRNARRREQKKLKYLKKTGVLGSDASIATMNAWEASGNRALDPSAPELSDKPPVMDESANLLSHSNNTSDQERSKKAMELLELETKRQQLLDAIASGGIDLTESKNSAKSKQNSRKSTNGNARTSGSDSENSNSPPEEFGTKEIPKAPNTAAPSNEAEPQVETLNTKSTVKMVPSSVSRRAKLDMAGSQRLLFGSLGVRAPKTQAEKDALQQKLAARPTRNANATGVTKKSESAKEAEPEEEDFGNWWDKIELTAVECVEDDVVLSTPPFPFYQRWDPQQRLKKANRESKKYSARKKGRKSNGDLVETYDKYNTGSNGDALDYDDAEEGDEYWEEGALLGNEYEWSGEDDEEAMQLLDETVNDILSDDLPPVPEDLSKLAPLAESDAQKGDVVIYTELMCSAATNWQPQMLTRTAQLQSKDDDGWKILLALRDMPPREYDDEGNRVYSKFEMEGLSDDEDEADGDGRSRTVLWNDLVDPKLLQRATPS